MCEGARGEEGEEEEESGGGNKEKEEIRDTGKPERSREITKANRMLSFCPVLSYSALL